MPQCAVATCRNSHRRTRGRRIRYHRFPQLPEVRSRWVRACGRSPLSNGDAPFNIQTARICSLHFTNDSYEKDVEHLVLGLPARSRLRRGAVPTIQVPIPVQPVTKMLVEDAKRSLLKVAHAKVMDRQKLPVVSSKKEHHHHHHPSGGAKMTKTTVKSPPMDEQKMAGIDVLLALGLKPAPRLNKIHAMDAVVGGVVGKTGEKCRKEETRDEKKYRKEEIVKKSEEPVKLEKKPITEILLLGGRTAFGSRNHQSSRAHRNHQNQQNGRASIDGTAAAASRHGEVYTVKKEPTSEPETDPEQDADTVSELRKLAARSVCVAKTDRDRKKRRSTDDAQNSNGSAKRACLEQREELISSLVGNEKISAEELTTRAEQLRVELQALDQLARAKEKEWNEILSLRKLKEEAYLRIERRRQVVGFMEGNGQLNESNLTPANLSLDHEWDNVKEKSVSAEATLSDKGSGPQSSLEQSENGHKEGDGQSADQRQVGEGRQGPMVDVRTIIADYRLRHPETVPRRSRRMRNSVNVALGAGGGVVETSQAGGDSRPSSTDSCKSSSNTADPNNSMSFKDVLVQFAKLSQQQGEAVKTPQNYPDVTLHPVMPTPTPQASTVQQSGSLLHGILTKSQSPRPTTFSPTLARLLTAPERERCNPVAASTPHQAVATQQLLQAYQGSNPVSISDLLSSSKARTEITITPVVNATTTPSHSNNLIHVEDVEEDATSIEERGRSTNAREDSPPRCQGCQERAAQFVCAGCGNQWYCSRECQVSAWDEHSEVCSG